MEPSRSGLVGWEYPVHQKVDCLIPIQGTYLGFRLGPVGACSEGNWSMFLFQVDLSLSLLGWVLNNNDNNGYILV